MTGGLEALADLDEPASVSDLVHNIEQAHPTVEPMSEQDNADWERAAGRHDPRRAPPSPQPNETGAAGQRQGAQVHWLIPTGVGETLNPAGTRHDEYGGFDEGGSGMPESAETTSDSQVIQREMVERGRALPGVATLLDVYGHLSAYTELMVNVQPSQVRNATGGNIR